MRAIILAAGEGTRLRPFTNDRPKCLVELAGRPLLQYQLDALAAAGIEDVTLVTGYRAEALASYGRPMRHNPNYASTNMVASLMCAADLLDGTDDVLIAYADIVYEPRIVEALCGCRRPLCTTVDRQWLRLWRARQEDPLTDAETLRLDAGGNIVEIGGKPKSIDEIEAQYMGLILARAEFARMLPAIYRGLDDARLYDGKPKHRMFMTSFLQHLVDHDWPVRAVPVDGGWLEVDSVSDLQMYERMRHDGTLDELCCLDFAPAMTNA
ncbi:MAG TPA: phosphocholine cytidylyltransferase family protein [Phycisphaerae bacterium]|nr:phosphocholine cytidylyltransferase family protein [Phycisphaerae bacterium]HOJ72614.1 phosphocholine cytidylyltransferase family protein [Phycisphaerae bacterium]HOQ84830.1 phosphocholine cytidylyltransferase family protein [Phycisphaerae bacterium]HPU24855.1 phosphocholine cytidylyltransferase family protein [Phycisphaerae bacterium]HQA00245.1 phosphocholine cytidylyltransferase family protein [Phycisphaerae bacterium]